MTTIRTEADAHSILEQPRDWPIQRWVREADLAAIERHNARAIVLRRMLLVSIGLWIGFGALVYFLLIR